MRFKINYSPISLLLSCRSCNLKKKKKKKRLENKMKCEVKKKNLQQSFDSLKKTKLITLRKKAKKRANFKTNALLSVETLFCRLSSIIERLNYKTPAKLKLKLYLKL